MRGAFAILLIMSALTGADSAMAQDFMRMVTCANAFYSDAASLDLRMEYRMYADATSTVPEQVTKGEYLKAGPRTFSNINGQISVVTEKAALTMDPVSRTLTVAGAGSGTFNPWGDFTAETLKKVFDRTELVSGKEGMYHFKLVPSAKIGNDITRMDIWFDAEKCYVKRIVMYFREMDLPVGDGKVKKKQRPRVDVNYTKVKWDAVPDPGIFSTDRYLRWDKGVPVPTAPYRDYAFINSLKP